jgi:hypothetical protein
MKTLLLFVFPFFFSQSLAGQQFQWAQSYDIENANEVSALTTDADGNLIVTGIHNAPITLPFRGNAFLIKTNNSGQVIREDALIGQVIIGDIAAVGNNILIIGQSWGAFTYRDESYGQGQYFMFALMLDVDGNHLWHFTDENRWGAEANISVGNNGNIALHIRGAGNARDWISIIDQAGNEIKGRQISSSFTLVSDIVYYNDKLFFNGGFNGPGSVMIDTILLELPPTQNAAITMGFNENLVAEWLFVDETFNNSVGQIVANGNGLYVFEPVVVDGFTSRNSLKHFSFDGQLTEDVDPPLFSPFAVFRVSLVSTPSHIALFTRNSSNGSNHIALIYDHGLNLEATKLITGGAQIFVPGHIAANDDALYITQVHNQNVDFGGSLNLPYTGPNQNFYLAELSDETTPVHPGAGLNDLSFEMSPNPASDMVLIYNIPDELTNPFLLIQNIFGSVIYTKPIEENEVRVDITGIPAGIYFISVFNTENPRQPIVRKLMVK